MHTKLRLLSLLLALTAALCLCACAAPVPATPAPATPEPATVAPTATATPTPTASPVPTPGIDWATLYGEGFADLAEFFVEGIDTVSLADLDFDGLPELIVTEYSVDTISYVYTVRDGQVEAAGTYFGERPTLIREKATGKHSYTTAGSGEGDGGWEWISRVDMVSGEVTDTELFYAYTWMNESSELQHEYRLGGEAADESAYNAALAQYLDGIETFADAVPYKQLGMYPVEVEPVRAAIAEIAATYIAAQA